VITPIKQLIDAALRKLGVIDAMAQPDALEYADALDALKTMLDAWTLEDLLVPYRATERFDLDSAKNYYSMGIGGDWDTVRPERIEYIRIVDAGGNAHVVQPTTLGLAQYQSSIPLGDPTEYTSTADPLFAYVELNAYPTSPTVLVTSMKPFNALAIDNFDEEYDPDADPSPLYPSGMTLTGIGTTIDFPPGYKQAMIYNLAVHLSPEYAGVTLTEVVVAMARGTKQAIKRRNSKPIHLRLEAPLRGWGRGAYDIVQGPVS
jgi:hypothetical protein